MIDSDCLVVRPELLASALNVCLLTVTRERRAGRIPQLDTACRPRDSRSNARGWRLATLQRWNPAIAERCARMIDPDPTPPDKAA